MSNYDQDVLGVGSPEHPANQPDMECMTFDEAMASLTDEQREVIEAEFIDRNAQVERYAKKLAKAKELMQAIEDAKDFMSAQTVESWGTTGTPNKSEWNKAYFTVQQKEEELKKLLLG